jgi:hypothetical protein
MVRVAAAAPRARHLRREARSVIATNPAYRMTFAVIDRLEGRPEYSSSIPLGSGREVETRFVKRLES